MSVEVLSGLSRSGLKALLLAIAAQATVVAGLGAAPRVRRGLRGRFREGWGGRVRVAGAGRGRARIGRHAAEALHPRRRALRGDT